MYDSKSRYIKQAYYKDRTNLLRLISACKFYGIDHKKMPNKLTFWVKKGYTDSDIIKEMMKMQQPITINIKNNRNRGNNRLLDIQELLYTCMEITELPLFNKYLDIGAGDCEITCSLSNGLKVDNNNTYAIDVESWSNKINGTTSPINYIYAKDSFESSLKPEFNSSFDIITIFQTIHHMKENIIKKVYDLLKPKGIVIIREHDVCSKTITSLCHIEHLIYSIFSDKMKLDDFFNEYYAKYYSKNDLVKEFENVGFKTLSGKCKNNPTKYYYKVFQKI